MSGAARSASVDGGGERRLSSVRPAELLGCATFPLRCNTCSAVTVGLLGAMPVRARIAGAGVTKRPGRVQTRTSNEQREAFPSPLAALPALAPRKVSDCTPAAHPVPTQPTL